MLKDMLRIKRAVKYSPLITAGIYLVFSALYIAFSDWIVARYISNIDLLNNVQTLKGLGFVIITALVLYFLIRSPLNKVLQNSVALSQAEEKIRLIIESMTDGIVVFDTRNKIIETNAAFVKLTGGQSKTDLIGQNIFLFFPVQDHSRLRQEINNVIASGHGSVLEFNLNREGGEVLPVQINISIVKNADGASMGIVAIIEDITERKKAQSKLQELYLKEKSQREELQEESKARGMFIDVLAHELRTPLTPIVASGGMLDDHLASSEDEITHKLIDIIVDSSNTLTRRLEDLLDIGRVSRGSFVLLQQRVNTSNYLQDIITRLKPTVEKSAHHILVNLPAALPLVRVDPARLEQVIVSLIDIAVRFSPPDSDILFSAGTGDGILYIEIADQGPGIPDSELTRLFSPYHRTEQDRQRYPGIGLGLAFSKQIIEAHGGKIKATSQPGKGNIFRIEI